MDLEPRTESTGVSGELFLVSLSLLSFCWPLKKEGAGVYCFKRTEFVGNKDPSMQLKKRKKCLGNGWREFSR